MTYTYIGLDENNTSQLQNIFNEFLEYNKSGCCMLNLGSKNKNIKTKKYLFDNSSKYKNTNFEFIINLAIELLNRYKYKVDKENVLMELTRYNCNGKAIKPVLDFHDDDFTLVRYKVNTVVFYVNKDITIKGGNFELEDQIIDTYTGSVILMNGNTTRRYQECNGHGQYDYIIVQIKSID